MKRIVAILAITFIGQILHAQQKKPWKVDWLCGRLEYVQKIPDHKIANTFSEKRKALRDVSVGLHERHENGACCDGLNAVETIQTGRGGHFEFKTKKPGDFWMATNWSGKEYKLAVVYKPEKNSPTMCSQQGIALDGEGSADWWITITVD